MIRFMGGSRRGKMAALAVFLAIFASWMAVADPPPLARPDLALQIGPASGVRALAFAPDGKTIATIGHFDQMARLWDINTGDIVRTFTHPDEVNDLLFTPDGKGLITAVGNVFKPGEILIWEVESGKLKQVLVRQQKAVGAIALSPDGKTLASGGINQPVRLFDIETGQEKGALEGPPVVGALAFSPDGKALAAAGGSARDKTGEVRIWDLRSGALRQTLSGHGDFVEVAAFSRDGRFLASGGHDKIVRVWGVENGELLRTISGHEERITGVAFSPTGNLLAVASGDKTVRLWDPETGQAVRAVTASRSVYHAVTFSPDGRTLAAGSEGVTLWDVEGGQGERHLFRAASVEQKVSVSPDGKLLASGGSDGAVRLWDLKSGGLRWVMEGHRGAVTAVTFSADGAIVASGSADKSVKLWDARAGTELRALEGHEGEVTAVALSRDGRLLVSASGWPAKKGELRVWDGRTGGLIRRLAIPGYRLTSLALSPDGETAATGSMAGMVWLWNVSTGEVRRVLEGQIFPVFSLAFSPDGKELASGSGGPFVAGEIRVWDAVAGKLARSIPMEETLVSALAFSPDGHTLASGGWDGVVRLLDRRTDTVRRLSPPHQFRVSSVAFDGDGMMLASGGSDGAIRLWEPRQGRELATLLTVPGSPDGRQEVSPPTEEVPTSPGGTPLPPPRQGPPLWLAVTPHGFYHCSEGTDHLVKWRFPGNRLVPFADFEESFRRPDLVRKSLAGQTITEQPLTLSRIPPACRFLNPKPNQTVTGNLLRLLVEATDDRAVTEMRLSINGVSVNPVAAKPITADAKPITADAKDVPAGHTIRRLFTVDVPLPAGERKLRIRARVYDDEMNKSDAVVTVERGDATPVAGELFLLSVGISEYRNPNYNLTYAARDAEAIADLLVRQTGRRYSRVRPTVLTDRRATATALRQALRGLNSAAPSDTVMIFLSGHGLQHQGKFYFAPHGIVANDIAGTGIPWQEVVDALGRTYARKLLFVDACHSGTKLGGRQATNGQLAEAVRRTGIVMLSSSQGDEFSFEDRAHGHGAFTVGLLEAFQGGADLNKDGIVTLPELEIYVPRRVSDLTKGLQHPHLVTVQDFNPATPLVVVK